MKKKSTTKPITDEELAEAIVSADGDYEAILDLIKSYAKDYAEMVIGSDCQGGHDDDWEVQQQCDIENRLRAEQRERMQ